MVNFTLKIGELRIDDHDIDREITDLCERAALEQDLEKLLQLLLRLNALVETLGLERASRSSAAQKHGENSSNAWKWRN